MSFEILLGEPEVTSYWSVLEAKYDSGKLSGKEEQLFKKLLKVLRLLSENPKHNSLSSHEISEFSDKFGLKIWQSYIENRTPAAGRIFWTYGPGKNQITILAIESHPETKRKSYSRIKLARLPGKKK